MCCEFSLISVTSFLSYDFLFLEIEGYLALLRHDGHHLMGIFGFVGSMWRGLHGGSHLRGFMESLVIACWFCLRAPLADMNCRR